MGDMLGSTRCIIHELDADPVPTRYFRIGLYGPPHYLTPSGEYAIETKRVDQTSDRLVSRKLLKGDLCEKYFSISRQTEGNQKVHLDNVVCYPSSLSDSARFLLLGDNDDEKMRLLIAPREGRALEIRPLSLSFNEAKRRLEAEWGKRRALKDEETRGTGN